MFRYYKILKGTERYNAVAELMERRKEGIAQMVALAKELGSPDGQAMANDSYLVGGLTGFYFKEQPEGWKKTRNYGFYYPKAKGNDEIHAKIATIPTIRLIELGRLVGYTSPFGSPGIDVKEDYALVEMDANYDPLSDMIEILGSEYKQLKGK